MRLTRLEISRTETYQTPPNQLVWIVELTGSTGKQAITLSPAAVSRLIACISTEVSETAKANAKQVKAGMQEAEDELLLVANDGMLTIG